jgi:hypothetical protein
MKRQVITARRQTLRRRGRTRTLIPVEFRPLLDSFDLDSHQQIELWSFSLVLLMLDEGQVRKIGTHQIAGTEWLTLQILTGEQFDIVKPEMSETDQERLLEGVREIVGKARRARRRRGTGSVEAEDGTK